MKEGVLHYFRGYRLGLFAGLVALAALVAGLVTRGMGPAAAASDGGTGAATGLGQLTGLLPQQNLVLESALQVDGSALNEMPQRLALQVLHGDKNAACIIAHIINGANVWVVQG